MRSALVPPVGGFESFDLDPTAITWLRRHYVPIGRLHEFLTFQGLQPQPTGPTTTITRWAGTLCAGLPSAMTTEVIAWLEALTATRRSAAVADYKQLQHRLISQAVAVPLYVQKYERVFSKSVGGYVDNPAYPNVVFVYDLRPTS